MANSQGADIESEVQSLLDSGHCNRYRLQEVCAKNGNRIPASVRKSVWAFLLGVEGLLRASDGVLDADLATTEEDLSNQRVVMADVQRTRQTIPLFQMTPVKHSAVKILTFYCKRKACIYRQVWYFVTMTHCHCRYGCDICVCLWKTCVGL